MNTDVKTITPRSTVQKAAKEMSNFRIGCLVVVEKEKLSGIITERDVITRLVAEDLKASETKVEEIMTTEVIMIEPDKDVSDAAEIMTEHKIKKLPVISNNRLVGIITLADICAVEPELIKKASDLFVQQEKKTMAG